MKEDELVPVYVDNIPDTIKAGMLYISEKYATSIHLCACGCGKETVCKLQPTWKDGWLLTKNEGLVTLRPSIGNWTYQNHYHAHYYITNNNIEWL